MAYRVQSSVVDMTQSRRGPAIHADFLRALVVALVLSQIASSFVGYAAFPGANGKIAFSSERDGPCDLYTMDADGSNVARLTNGVGALPPFDEQRPRHSEPATDARRRDDGEARGAAVEAPREDQKAPRR